MEAPKPYARFTITAPDGAGFDVHVPNMHGKTEALALMIERAGYSAYSEVTDTPPADHRAAPTTATVPVGILERAAAIIDDAADEVDEADDRYPFARMLYAAARGEEVDWSQL